jgi:hypothetical protein
MSILVLPPSFLAEQSDSRGQEFVFDHLYS